MATKDGLAQIWYADANGVITGNTPNADNVASAIIDGYNEHFGTGIAIWTPETINLQVGDTVPNWNAYEKIEMQPQKISIDMGQNVWIIGDFLNGLYRNWTNPGDSTGISVHEDGVVFGNQGLPEYVGVAMFNEFLSKIGLEATSVKNYYISMEIGSKVPGWENYTKIPK